MELHIQEVAFRNLQNSTVQEAVVPFQVGAVAYSNLQLACQDQFLVGAGLNLQVPSHYQIPLVVAAVLNVDPLKDVVVLEVHQTFLIHLQNCFSRLVCLLLEREVRAPLRVLPSVTCILHPWLILVQNLHSIRQPFFPYNLWQCDQHHHK